MHRAIVVLAGALCFASAAMAAPVLSMDNVPAKYVPGQPFSFDVVLTGAENLAAYNVSVLMALQSGQAGSDAAFQQPAAPASRYVFTTDLNFVPAGSPAQWIEPNAPYLDDPNAPAFKGSVSDFHDPNADGNLVGVETVSGVNDLVVTVTVDTSASLTGSIYLAFDPNGLELDTPAVDPNGDPVPITGADAVRSAIATEQPREIEMIPEPLTIALLLSAAPIALRTRKRR